MIRTRITTILLGACLSAAAQPLAELPAFLDANVERQLAERDIAGAVVAVVDQGEVLLARGYGLADVATGRAMESDTVIRLASVTKVFTAVAALQLVEAGRLDLDTDVNRYLDYAIPVSMGRPVTLRTLLTHHDGFETWTGGIGTLMGQREPLGSYLPRHLPRRIADAEAIPRYSNYGAAVAAYIVERVSGQPFEQYLEENVFDPLGMADTSARQPLPDNLMERTTAGYARASESPDAVTMAAATIQEAGSTGVGSTAEDMAQLMLALLNPPKGFLAPPTIKQMQSAQVAAPRGYMGLGFYTPVASGGNPFVGHDGGSGGIHGTMALLPERDFGIFVFYNSQGVARNPSAEGELLQLLAQRFFADAKQPLVTRAEGAVAGSYEPVRRAEKNLFKLRALLEQLAIRGSEAEGLRLGQAAIPFGGLEMEEAEPGIYRGGGLELSFAGGDGAAMLMEIGAPVALYERVAWWSSAGWVIPALVVAILFSAVCILRWVWQGLFKGRREFPASRGALLLLSNAIMGAFWLVTVGDAMVALSDPWVTPWLLAVYVAAWGGIILTAIAGWGLIRPRREEPHAWKEWLVFAVAAGMSVFCLVWKIAGTTLTL